MQTLVNEDNLVPSHKLMKELKISKSGDVSFFIFYYMDKIKLFFILLALSILCTFLFILRFHYK